MLGECTHCHHMMVGTKSNTQLVTHLQLLCPLGSLAVDFHFTGFDRGSSKRSRFEEARRPQPFVEPHPDQLF